MEKPRFLYAGFYCNPKPMLQIEAKLKVIFLFSCKRNLFSQERFCTWSRFEGESCWNPEIAYYVCFKISWNITMETSNVQKKQQYSHQVICRELVSLLLTVFDSNWCFAKLRSSCCSDLVLSGADVDLICQITVDVIGLYSVKRVVSSDCYLFFRVLIIRYLYIHIHTYMFYLFRVLYNK